MAPALDLMGAPLVAVVWPPLSIRITALIQSSATPKRRDASLIKGVQRAISDDVPVDNCSAILCEAGAGAASAGEPATMPIIITQAGSSAGKWRSFVLM